MRAQRLAYAFFSAAFAALILTKPAAADQACKLEMVAELPLTISGEAGLATVPVELEGKQMSMVVDMGAFASVLSQRVVNDLHLASVQIGQDIATGATGRSINHGVRTGQFRVGPLDLSGSSMLAEELNLGEGVVGLLGDDVLKRFDLDFDFGHRRLRLFSPDHCPGQVVYWSKHASIVPMEIRADGHIFVPISIDGHALHALLDTGASTTTMYLDIAWGQFGISPETPGVTPANGGSTIKIYKYRFNSLTIGDITISHPELGLLERGIMHTADWRDMAESHGTRENLDVYLGIRQLRNLHLYVAREEEKLYVTPADTN